MYVRGTSGALGPPLRTARVFGSVFLCFSSSVFFQPFFIRSFARPFAWYFAGSVARVTPVS